MRGILFDKSARQTKVSFRLICTISPTFIYTVSNMKILLQLILIFATGACFAQPTGSQKIYLEITDHEDTLDFASLFKKNDFDNKVSLKYKNYQLLDVSHDQTGFGYYSHNEHIHKTLFHDHNHVIQLVKDKSDTMRIELFNTYRVYFLSIPFQKGNYRLYVNDGKDHQWEVNTLPTKVLRNGLEVLNISPDDWSVFEVKPAKSPQNYFISHQFEIQELLAKSVLPEEDPNFKNPRRMSNLRVEVEDYNFDGQKDYREHKWNDTSRWNYFIYADADLGYVLDPFLSNLDIHHFDFEKKNFWVAKRRGRNSQQGEYDIYHFIDGKPTLVIDQAAPVPNGKQIDVVRQQIYSKSTYDIGPFKFVFEKNTPGINLPDIPGFYANKISVVDAKTNLLIDSVVAVGNVLKETEGCSDSLEIADYNFDGLPDFRVCNNSVANKHTYYLYHSKKKSFIIEKTLSALHNVTFDFEQKIAKGQSAKLSLPSMIPQQSYSEQLQFEGNALATLTVTTMFDNGTPPTTEKCKYINQKRIYDGDNIGLKLVDQKPLTKKVGPFKFEILFNPEEYQPSNEKGSYVRILKIYEKNKTHGPFEIPGNYLREVPHWLDSLEIADYNFDGFPDIRLFNSASKEGRYHYIIYHPEREEQAFYVETLFSDLVDHEFNPKLKILKGKINEPNHTLYLFLKNDTLTLTRQDHDRSKPPFIEQSIYRNGDRQPLRSAYGSLVPALKKEYGDYNFDGYEDFRRQSSASPYLWDVFIFNPKKQTFVIDPLLSKFDQFEYDPLNRSLLGTHRMQVNDTTSQTDYYKWSFTEMKLVLYQQKVCIYDYPSSESNTCVISALIDGKWVEIEIFGAE